MASLREFRAGHVKGATQLIIGAPGAGKTALLEQLRERWAPTIQGAHSEGAIVAGLDAEHFGIPPVRFGSFWKRWQAKLIGDGQSTAGCC